MSLYDNQQRNIMRNYIKIGVAGPVGAGKTALIENWLVKSQAATAWQ